MAYEAPLTLDAQTHLDAARDHAAVAEKTYGNIAKEYERLQASAPNLSPKEALNQSITTLYGDKAPEVAARIARDADRSHIFNAGEEFVQAYADLKKAGLNSVNNRLGKRRTFMQDVVNTRNSLTHPEQIIESLPESEFPHAAETASKYAQQELDTLRTMPVAADKIAARDEAVAHLERMRKELESFSKPGGYRLSRPEDLMPEDLARAAQMQEISAGSHAAVTKAVLKDAGHAFDTHRFPNAPEPMDVVPGTRPGSHPVDALQVRRDDLAHLDPKPEHPGAFERARQGQYLSEQLPKNADEIMKPPVAAGPEPLFVAAEANGLSKILQHGGAFFLAAAPVANAGAAAYSSAKAGDTAMNAALKAAKAAGISTVDMIAPNARTGYRDVVGDGLTPLDRALNGASDASQTAFISSSVATVAGAPTVVGDVIPAGAAAIFGVANVGINAAKAMVKITGYAGDKQDGGYVYDAGRVVTAVGGMEYRAAHIVVAAAYAAAKDGAMKLDAVSGGEEATGVQAPSGSPKSPGGAVSPGQRKY